MLTLQVVLLLAKLAAAARSQYAQEVPLPHGQLRHKAKPLHYVCQRCQGGWELPLEHNQIYCTSYS
jgi:hypothetical protein